MTASRPAEDTESAVPARVGVIGGGRMGAGIAHAFALAGASVVVIERDADAAAAAAARVVESLRRSVERGGTTRDLAGLTAAVETGRCRGPRRLRTRHRGGARRPRAQGRRPRTRRTSARRGGRARVEHLVDLHRRPCRRPGPPRPPARSALLQPGPGVAARRDRGGARHRARTRRRRPRLGRRDRQGARRRARQPRVRVEPTRCRARARGDPHARGGCRFGRRHRRGDGARLPASGRPPAHDRHRRARRATRNRRRSCTRDWATDSRPRTARGGWSPTDTWAARPAADSTNGANSEHRDRDPAQLRQDAWWSPAGPGPLAVVTVRDASTGEEVARLSTDGLDLAGALEYARTVGQRSLGALQLPRARAAAQAVRHRADGAQGGALRAVEARRRDGARLAQRRRRRHRRALHLLVEGPSRAAERAGVPRRSDRAALEGRVVPRPARVHPPAGRRGADQRLQLPDVGRSGEVRARVPRRGPDPCEAGDADRLRRRGLGADPRRVGTPPRRIAAARVRKRARASSTTSGSATSSGSPAARRPPRSCARRPQPECDSRARRIRSTPPCSVPTPRPARPSSTPT